MGLRPNAPLAQNCLERERRKGKMSPLEAFVLLDVHISPYPAKGGTRERVYKK